MTLSSKSQMRLIITTIFILVIIIAILVPKSTPSEAYGTVYEADTGTSTLHSGYPDQFDANGYDWFSNNNSSSVNIWRNGLYIYNSGTAPVISDQWAVYNGDGTRDALWTTDLPSSQQIPVGGYGNLYSDWNSGKKADDCHTFSWIADVR